MNKIAEIRRSKNVSQAELAKKSGITQAFMSEIECGKKKGSVFTLLKIAGVLGVSV